MSASVSRVSCMIRSGNSLSALNYRVSAIQGLPHLLPEAREGLTQLRTLVTRIDGEVDRMTMELRSPTLDDTGLVDALVSYTNEWASTTGISVDMLPVQMGKSRLPPVMRLPSIISCKRR